MPVITREKMQGRKDKVANMKEKKYVVQTWDGIAGESWEYATLDEAKKNYEQEKEYYISNGYHFEWIELYKQDENGEKIEIIEETYPEEEKEMEKTKVLSPK